MYIVTFYSFKGGVGRSMALVNTAVELCQRGRRVLIVDFDLEAPGISTFDLFSGATTSPGIVDYVTDFVETQQAPDVRRYVSNCPKWKAGQGELWIMPAGKQDENYSAKFNSINWKELYAQHSGYLMFEDMKAQWKEALAPDYVLIDSRTGHTDVGGICTRQLPDAVAIMFFPNEQNLQGLKRIIEDIRAESDSVREKKIDLHFIPSNVPDLDDEDSILADRIARFRATLDYDAPAATIHHYNNLSLLNQVIFTKDRDKSILTKEYRQLVDAIVANNLEDRNAAIAALTEIQSILGRPGRERELPVDDVEEKLNEISAAHAKDGEILFRMGVVRERMGNLTDALALYNAAIDAQYKQPTVFMYRAQAHRLLKNDKAAMDDISAVLRNPAAAERDLVFATRWLSEIGPGTLKEIELSPAISQSKPAAKIQVASQLMSKRENLPTAEKFLRSIVSDSDHPATERINAEQKLVLVLIGLGRFKEAMQRLRDLMGPSGTFQTIDRAFNYAMADWGHEGVPRAELFARVIEKYDDKFRGFSDANVRQCMALCYALTHDRNEAERELQLAETTLATNPRLTFSCWRYLDVPPNEFREDLAAIRRLISGKRELPEFMVGASKHEVLL